MTTPSDHRTNEQNVWPDRLMIRDTQLHDDLGGLGQRIYTTAGQGYEKREYIRADGVLAYLKWLTERVEWLKYEMDHGGDWKYLQLKREETMYCLEKLKAHIPALQETQRG